VKKLITFLFVVLVAEASFAQKFGYVDSQYILNQMPGYAEAQQEIEKLAKGWESEIQAKYKEVEEMEVALKAEEVLLTKEMWEEKNKKIQDSWVELREYQQKIFGSDGLYFLKKKELIKPVQDEVFDAVERVAKNNRLQIVFDKSGDLVMIYTDPVHDYTDFVLEELGLKENQNPTNN
jgi:outer membrane protein